MKRITAAATLAIAALSLSACTGGTSGPAAAETSAASAPVAIAATSAPADPSPAHTSSAPAPTAPGLSSPNDDRQAYADGAINRWLASQGANSFAGFSEPFKNISYWASPDSDTLALVVDDAVEDYAVQKGGDVTEELRKIGANLVIVANSQEHQISKVRVDTADGKHSTVVRYDEPPVTVD